MSEQPVISATAFEFDARGVAKRFRHAAIFGALESLGDGETMRFMNDHDPLPLLEQIEQRYGDQIDIAYVARETDNIVIDFTVQLNSQEDAEHGHQAGGCSGDGNGGGGCCGGCSGQH